jgi:hypothetical protein
MLQARACVARGEAAVVDQALRAQAFEDALHVLRLEALAQQGPPQLALRVVAARELLEGALVGRLG